MNETTTRLGYNNWAGRGRMDTKGARGKAGYNREVYNAIKYINSRVPD